MFTRTLILGFAAAVVVLPMLGFKFLDARWTESLHAGRVPAPLEYAEILYRNEESWGFPPSGNETGFVVYQLTPESVTFARANPGALATIIPDEPWRPTPIDPEAWHVRLGGERNGEAEPHEPDIAEYLERWGHPIPLDATFLAEANRAIRNEGAYYSRGSGGSTTVISPDEGRVYFFYAG